MPCYLKLIPKNIITTGMKKSKKGAQDELKRAFAEKRISLVAYDEMRRKIDACVEIPGHTHNQQAEQAA